MLSDSDNKSDNNTQDKIEQMETIMLSMRRMMFQNRAHGGQVMPSASQAALHVVLKRYAKKPNQPMTASELAKELDVSASAVSQLIDKLELKGIVKRQRSDTNKRVVYLVPTKRGQKIIQKVSRHHSHNSELLKDLFDYLGEEDSEKMLYLVRRIRDFAIEREKK